ncbi:hypothetical protein [Ochrovirga pacifica]|uniref:hypothetical protein n=1 Tax=Ochrovirga pacifica TaxID=1042376 RepID=UPI0002557FD3|nr:hypothetical protein [Ochrovirga pacifica]
MKKICICLLSLFFLKTFAQKTLTVPVLLHQKPAAGKRVKVIPPKYAATDLFYSLYLPEGYQKNKKYPVIVEYTGNYYPPTQSTGNLKDASLGYAIAKNIEAIWICLPFVTKDYKQALKWWGDEQNTIDYALENIKDVCLQYNGNSGQVFLIGFSRGAIAVNYIGLHNDAIADVWRGFFSHDHYDGEQKWGKYWAKDLPSYRAQAKIRAQRLKGRAALISNHQKEVKKYIDGNGLSDFGTFTYLKPDVHKATKEQNLHVHNDRWLLTQLDDAKSVFNWFQNSLNKSIGVYTVSGKVTNSKGKPIGGLLVNAGSFHFDSTDINGNYCIEGLTNGERTLKITTDFYEEERTINLYKNIQGVDFVIKPKNN